MSRVKVDLEIEEWDEVTPTTGVRFRITGLRTHGGALVLRRQAAPGGLDVTQLAEKAVDDVLEDLQDVHSLVASGKVNIRMVRGPAIR